MAGAGAVLLILTWWRGAPPATGPGATSTDAGRLTGLLAGYVALLQVLLRARLGAVERSLGTDRINMCHRLLGAYLLVLVLAHATLVTLGYAHRLHRSVPSTIRVLFTGFPYVAWAVIAACLLTLVGLSSVPVLRRHLAHEVWHALHLLVYVALTLAFFHQVTVGEHLLHSRLMRTTWTLLWATIAAALLWSRWLRPLHLAAKHRLRIAEIRLETPRTISIKMVGHRLDRFPAEAGQYFRWRFLDARSWFVARPYSLSAEPDGRHLRITAATGGRYSSRLPELRVGTLVIPEGPCGALAPPRHASPALLIAGGIGITPLRAIFARCSAASVLVYRAHSAQDLLFRSELDEIADRPNAQVRYLVGPRHEPGNELTADELAAIHPDMRATQVYICGHASFVRHVRTALATLDVSRRNIHSESFEPW